MTYWYAFKAVDRLLRDLMKVMDQSFEEISFGEKVVVFKENFHQILSVVIKKTCENIIRVSLYQSILWKNVRLMKLKTNICFLYIANDPDAIK